MNIKRICVLCMVLLLCASAAAADVELSNESRVYSGSSTIILNVPTTHTITFQCGEHGCVMADSVLYRGNSTMIVGRNSTAAITILPEKGYTLDTVTASDTTGVSLEEDQIIITDAVRDYVFVLAFVRIEAQQITVTPQDVVLAPGMDISLSAVTVPEGALVSWSIGDEDVATVSEDGTLHANAKGSTEVTASDGTASDTASVTVRDLSTWNLPAKLAVVEEEAMMGNTAVENIILSGNVTTLENRAFANCTNLRYITIPDSVVQFGQNCFSGCGKLIILCHEGSAAQSYAVANGLRYQIIP